jgi:Mg-chelatase subunit ChlD
MKIEWDTELPAYSTDNAAATCLLSLVAQDIDTVKRAPVSITLVLDRSGSMIGSKIELVKRSSLFLLKLLNPRDSVSTIDFCWE